MGRRSLTPLCLAAAVTLLLAACGGGGGGGGGPVPTQSEPLSGHIHITESYPVNRQVQVPVDAAIRITFDSAIFHGSVSSGQVTLTTGGGAPVLGTYVLSAGQTILTFTPMEPLAANADYLLTVGTQVFDTGYRTLAAAWSITFRTLDRVPPTVNAYTPPHSATSVDPKGVITVTFSEEMDPATLATTTVGLRDSQGAVPCTLSLSGTLLTVTPVADLRGGRDYTFSVKGNAQGAKDRSGNPLGEDLTVGFRAAYDTTGPELVGSIPATGTATLSPATRIRLLFDDSIDPWSVEPTAIVLRDDANSTVPTTLSWSDDGRTGLVTPGLPLDPARQYVLMLASGIEGIMNVSGTAVTAGRILTFRPQADNQKPQVTETVPVDETVNCAVNTVAEVTFDRAMVAATFTATTVTLVQGTTPVAVTPALSGDGMTLQVTPGATLATNTDYTLTVKGGWFGVCSTTYLPLAEDLVIRFRTTGDGVIPAATLYPGNGLSQVAVTTRFVAIFSEAMNPDTLTTDTVRLRDANTLAAIPGSITVERGGKVVRYTPSANLPASSSVRFEVVGGPYGVKDGGGNWLTETATATVSVGYHTDTTAPVAWLTLNGIDPSRNADLDLPPFGFSIDLSAIDPSDNAIDPTSLAIHVTGGGGYYPDADEIFTGLEIRSQDDLRCTIPPNHPFATGEVKIYATVADLSGNRSAQKEITATVRGFNDGDRPLERNQVVFLDFDTDREGVNGDGTSDWVQDLVDYGLLSATDPMGTNATMRALMEAAVLAKVNELFGRGADGSHAAGAVAIRFVTERPPGSIPFTHMAIGGQDPQGGKRTLGQSSTGVLGRAWYDRKNANFADNNSVVSPGLGIFPGELFLYQGNLHRQLYPGYLTTFGSRFRLLSPHFSGTPAGEDLLDTVVTDPDFDFDTASAAERSRYLAIFQAADDLAVAVATLLAHEVGHSLGLVTPGVCPCGLHGDSSLHCSPSSFGQLMNSVVGYDGLVEEIYGFRALNMAYLREQILVR